MAQVNPNPRTVDQNAEDTSTYGIYKKDCLHKIHSEWNKMYNKITKQNI